MPALPNCPVIRVDERTPPSEARDVQRRAGSGMLRIGHGAYVPRDAWDALTPHERHLVRITVHVRPRTLLSHESALAVHGIRTLAPWPDRVALIVPGTTRSDRRGRWLVKHPSPPGRGVMMPLGATPVPVTDMDTTGAAIARAWRFRDAVVVLDQLLRRGASRRRMIALVAEGPVRASRRATTAIEFADAASDSVGESVARVAMHFAGTPTPVLQQEFRGPGGRVARVDFWFPEQGAVIEFDGETKYRDPGLRGGRSAEQVVIDEKYREDWIRALPGVRSFRRIRTRDVEDRRTLEAVLRAAGVPLGR